MSANIADMSSGDKIVEMLKRSVNYMPDALKEQWNALLSPQNITIMSATMLLFIVSHMFGVGEVVDAILLLVGAAMMGPAIVQAAEHFLAASDCTDAKSEPDLEKCADELAKGVILLGIDIAMIVLLRRQAKGLQASRGGPGASWYRVAKPGGRAPVPRFDPGGTGLPRIAPDPQPGALWSRYADIPDPNMAPGTGKTSFFGEIRYSSRGSLSMQEAALGHERVHQFFTPRIRPLRTFRAQLRVAGYGRSVLLRYLEEMFSEFGGQTIIDAFRLTPGAGVTVLQHIIRFPIMNNYVTIAQMAAEGQAIGTILLGTQVFTVTFATGPLDSIFSQYPETIDLRKRSVVGVWLFEIPAWKPATEEQRYAEGWKGIVEFEGSEEALQGRCYWADRRGGQRHYGSWSVSMADDFREGMTFRFDDDDPNVAKRRTFSALVGNNVCQGNYKNPGWPDGWFRISR